MKNVFKRNLDGPEAITESGRPLDIHYTQTHGGATSGFGKGQGKQPGHRQEKHHPKRKSGHETPIVPTFSARGQPTKEGQTHLHPVRHGNQSAPGLVVKQVGSSHGMGMGQSTHTPPSGAKRNKGRAKGGMESVRPQQMPTGIFAHLSGHQGRVMGKPMRIVKKMIGSRRMADNY